MRTTPARRLWGGRLNIRQTDFLSAPPEAGSANFLAANPPYVRHQHIPAGRKLELREAVLKRTARSISGLAGLHCHFLLLAHAWLARGAVSAWLIPGEFLEVNYGASLKDYLLRDARLIRIHRHAPNKAVFGDALVSPAAVWFVNDRDDVDRDILITRGASRHGGTGAEIRTGRREKWGHAIHVLSRRNNSLPDDGRLGDFFAMRRGIATGANDVFILTQEQTEEHGVEERFLRPIVPPPRQVRGDELGVDADGLPLTEPQRFLLDCDPDEDVVRERHSGLWAWLLPHRERLLQRCVCRARRPWYRQERRPPAPPLCSYMGRRSASGAGPFRFVLNESGAPGSNAWLLLHPRFPMTPETLRLAWMHLRSLPPHLLEREGRVYGGGLCKVEPRELASAPCPGLRGIILGEGPPLPPVPPSLPDLLPIRNGRDGSLRRTEGFSEGRKGPSTRGGANFLNGLGERRSGHEQHADQGDDNGAIGKHASSGMRLGLPRGRTDFLVGMFRIFHRAGGAFFRPFLKKSPPRTQKRRNPAGFLRFLVHK